MAGTLRKDAAIEQFYKMRENTHKSFRMNRKSGPFVFIVAALIPSLLLYTGYQVAGKTSFVARRRDESVWRSN
ncbi:hypothetical protein TRVA0_025S02102 [Trichomonascus vanleenenianus]|uniref:uncharacterized protein n=1 Tax=Trichomonascus vanleenenianus TaxID=2268995 RepID=UPI003EC9E7EB